MDQTRNHLKPLLKSLKALADGNRLRLLRLLMDQPRCVCELTAALGIAQPTVSRHLSILEEAGWLDKQRQGMFTIYALISGLDPQDHRAGLLAALKGWLKADPELAALARFLKTLDRRDLFGKPVRSRPGVCRASAEILTPSGDG